MDTSRDLPPGERIFPRLAVVPPDTSTWGDDAAALRRLHGEIIHQALALMEPGAVTDQGVSRRLNQARALLGIPQHALDLEPLVSNIVQTLGRPEIARFFGPKALALTEQEVVVPGRTPGAPCRLVRIDRLVLLPDGTPWVLDFKLGFGDPDADKRQVREYQALVADIFQRPCHGALIHLDRSELMALEPVGLAPRQKEASRSFAPDPTSFSRPTEEVLPRPIQVFPLDADLISLLQSELLARHDPARPMNLAEVQIIFPHRRPKLYLLQKLAQAVDRPFLPPRCLSLEDWILRQACLGTNSPPTLASALDQAWLLHLVQEAGNEQSSPTKPLSWHQFLPWGLRLARVMGELDRELVTARNVALPPGDLPPLAQDILARLGRLQEGFHKALHAARLTTQAALAGNIDPDRLAVNKATYLCGLFALTGSEAALVEALRRRGARLWWQSGNPLPDQLLRWVWSWQAELQWMDKGAKTSERHRSAQVSFVQAHDLHSQLRHLAEDFASCNPQDQMAIILPDPSLLRPLLAHLPPSHQVNITLGLPLERTALGMLFHTLAQAARSGQISGTSPNAREFLGFLQNPWVRRLLPEGMPGLLRRILTERAGKILDAEERARIAQCVAERFGLEPLPYPHLAQLFFEALDLDCLSSLGWYLKRLLSALQVRKADSSPLEMQVVHALYSRIIPEMEHALSSTQTMPSSTLWNIFWTSLRSERTPLRGEPLTPWQVMGLLESRLLCFDKVVVLECLEGILPPAEAPNPLLPDALRPVLSLPPGQAEERIVRHHFQRLLASAKEVRLYTRQGLAADSLEGRTIPSRYWEQALWEEEKSCGELLEGHIARVPLELTLTAKKANFPAKEPILGLLSARLTKGLSLSALNTYLSCPIRFFYEQIARFTPMPDPSQDQGARTMGEVAHKVLENLFRPVLQQQIIPRELIPRLEAIWNHDLAEGLRDCPLSPVSRFFHVRLLRKLLVNYLDQAVDPIRPILVEEQLQRKLPGKAGSVLLRGRLDRVDLDLRTGLHVILDYKTGRAPMDGPLDVSLLWELSDHARKAPMNRDALVLLRERLPNIQLAGYLYLLDSPAQCGFVQLGEWDPKKSFVPLFKPDRKDERGSLEDFLRWQREGLPMLLEWLGRHVLEAPVFFPACLAQSCKHCPWSPACPWTETE